MKKAYFMEPEYSNFYKVIIIALQSFLQTGYKYFTYFSFTRNLTSDAEAARAVPRHEIVSHAMPSAKLRSGRIAHPVAVLHAIRATSRPFRPGRPGAVDGYGSGN